MVRRRGSTIYTYQSVDIELDASEVIEQITNEELLEELKRRKLEEKAKNREKIADPLDMLGEVIDLLKCGDAEEALLVLERLTRPKFSSLESCEAAFKSRLMQTTGL